MTSPATVRYSVGFRDRNRHLYDVEATFPVGDAEGLELSLATWTPGSYLVREYARHLQDLLATDENHRALAVRKTSKSTWHVETAGAREVRVRYRVYAHELTVRTSHLDDTHAYWNGAPMFLYVEALRALPCRVRVEVPPGWAVSTALERAADDPAVLVAADLDELIDSPVEIGTHERHAFTAAGLPHELAIYGATDVDRHRLASDIKRIVETEAEIFGNDLPYARYTFLAHFAPGGQGGLEHKRSTTLVASPYIARTKAKYQDFLELVAHEFFHLWNGKRIHPDTLGPFDYQREAYTRSLWVVEGWTSYYDRHVLRRAGLVSTARYLEKLGEELTKLSQTPGRLHHSLEEASFDAWIKFYRPDETTANSTVSYYLKGSLVALLLDLEIRRRTAAAAGGKRTLDDVLRLFWRRHGRDERGYRDVDVQPLVEEAAGVALDDFFRRYVRGTDELDVEGALASVGLTLQAATKHAGHGAWLGVTTTKDAAGRVRIKETREDGPAADAGLAPGDELLALDGWRLDEEALKDHLGAHHAGERVKIAFFRRDRLRELEVTLAPRPADKIEVVAVEHPTDEARAAYRAWLGDAWPPHEAKTDEDDDD